MDVLIQAVGHDMALTFGGNGRDFFPIVTQNGNGLLGTLARARIYYRYSNVSFIFLILLFHEECLTTDYSENRTLA